MRKLKYIITGTGRCGTVYYARLLDSLGIKCTHEGVFCPGTFESVVDKLQGRKAIITSNRSREYDPFWASGNCEADSSYMAAPFLDREEFKETKVIHLVRHPIKVISSYYFELQYYKNPKQRGHNYMDYVYAHLPVLLDENLSTVHRITKFYLEWNKLIVSKCQEKIASGKYLFHKIEDGCEPVLAWLGLKPTKNMYKDEKANTMKHRIDTFSINQIPAHPVKTELIEFANKHGYNLTPRSYIPKLFL